MAETYANDYRDIGNMSENLPPPSLMARKFMAYSKNPEPNPNTKIVFRETWYFFYGTLMDPKTLMKVLGRPEPPEVHSALVYGHKLMLWREYPAAVYGGDEDIIQGIACKINSKEEADRLESYETDMYRVKGCPIWLQDGTKLAGSMFFWQRDISALREGQFILKDWLATHDSTRG